VNKTLPPILYVCGSHGTGKTSSVKTMVDIANKYSGRTPEDKPDKFVFINCKTLAKLRTGRAISHILQRLGKNHKEQNFLHRIDDKSQDAVTLVVLDEVDALIGMKGSETMLQYLLRMANEEQYCLAIIGISNAIHNKTTDRLRQIGFDDSWNSKIVFPAYSKDDFLDIIKQKTGFSVLTENTAFYIAARVASNGGDARKFFDYVQTTIHVCLDRFESKLHPTKSQSTTSIYDAMTAFKSNSTDYKQLIAALPSIQKHLLCCGVWMSRYLNGAPVKTSDLKTAVFHAYGHEVGTDMTLEEFKNTMELLESQSLLQVTFDDPFSITKNKGPMQKLSHFVRPVCQFNNYASLLRSNTTFPAQLEDVESALEQTLMNDTLYRTLFFRFKDRFNKRKEKLYSWGAYCPERDEIMENIRNKKALKEKALFSNNDP